jgi:putative Ig domain-containing protein/List-Bact-rpt repeat protein
MTRKRLLAGIVVPMIFAAACGGDAPTTVPPNESPAFSRGSTVRLQVNKSGTGAGTVTSNPSGINCGSSCSKSFSKGTIVTLTATPASGSEFAGWSGGGCSGTGSCTVTLNSNTTVTATFNASGGGTGPFTLSVTKVQNGNGSGTVSSIPAGISCDPTCAASFPAGTSITLNVEVSTGRFASWSGGGCSGNAPSCTLTLTANTTVTATFETSVVTITTESPLPDGNRGADYSAFLTSSGGQGSPDKYSLVSGSLPKGLTMAESYGVQSTLISGRPTTEQTSTFTVRVQDQSGSSTKTFTITINPPTPLVITMPGATCRAGTVGTAYFQNLFASGGSTPYTWSVTAGQLPPGLALIRASNGNRVEGTPTTAGTFTFTLTVTDSFGAKASQQTSITVN